MDLLGQGVDVAFIAMLLGHERLETTHRTYLHADMSIKERALARTAPLHTKPGRYRPPDRLLSSSRASDYAQPARPNLAVFSETPGLLNIISCLPYWRSHLDHERHRVHESHYDQGVIPLAG